MFHALSLVWLACVPLQDPPDVLDSAQRAEVGELLRTSQAAWEDQLASARKIFQSKPRALVAFLVTQLVEPEWVPGLPVESTHYTVSGNALTVLENFTDLRLDVKAGKWLGFRVHDHRTQDPDFEGIVQPWRAWLRGREGIPESEWFWGLSARELWTLQEPMRTPEEKWQAEALAPAMALGRRAYPYLLDRLLDGEWACWDTRQADQANRLLARLSGGAPEPLEVYQILTLKAGDPLREQGIAHDRNLVAMRRAQERWMLRLLAR